MADAVILDHIVKTFDGGQGEQVTAVDHLSLTIERGEIFSLVGPDGAGKTTTIRMMCGVLSPTEGKISLLGFDLRTQKEEIKKHIGYLSQRFSLYQDLTIDENMDFFAEIHKVRNYHQRKEELLQFTRLAEFRKRLAGQLSGGMKQKLALACTLIHTPTIIFLDEPTTGVDPVSRRDFWKILSSLLKSGITIVVSTPYLDEAERSSRVALMNQGRVLTCNTPEVIKSSFHSEVIELVCSPVRAASVALLRSFQRKDIQLFGDRLHILTKNAKKEEKEILKVLQKEHIEVQSHRIVPASLEDVFIARITAP
ncbi:MAG: ABC transporter ATP-binding protein [Ignavibacteriae bacterium]|nr:MAG: ABC transporter ATP-binding protein [Ignavibacteriota bacterium]